MNNKQLILTLLLIPGLTFATQQTAQDFDLGSDSDSEIEIEHKENESQDAEKTLPLESDSSVPAPRSDAVGSQVINEVSHSQNNAAYYEQRAAAITADTERILKNIVADDNSLALKIARALERISEVKPEIAIFEAIDKGDIEYVRTHLQNGVIIFDKRSLFLNFIYHISEAKDKTAAGEIIDTLCGFLNRNGGFTPIKRAAARGDKQMVLMLLDKDQCKRTNIIPYKWMFDPSAEVDLNVLYKPLTQGFCQKSLISKPKTKLAMLIENSSQGDITLRPPLNVLLMSLSELFFAAISGNTEIVDLLLVCESSAIDRCNILNTLLSVSVYSNVAQLPMARALFKNLGISNRPLYENYPTIARKLVRALKTNFPPSRIAWINRMGDDISTTYSWKEVVTIAQSIMPFGSIELSLAIADELSTIADEAEWINERNDGFEYLVQCSKNAEKLGLILSMDNHPQSLTYQLGMGMLSHVEKNPTLLANLKRYIEGNAYINNAVNNHLPSDLSPIVADYVSPRLPNEYIRYIMALENQHDNNQLGENMQGIMLGERPIVNTTRASPPRRSICSWLMQKMFEACRRRNL